MDESKALTVFNFQNREVRTIIIDGELWCVLKDVCEVLDIADHKTAANRLDEDEKGVHTVRTLGGNQQMLCTNESGVYHLTFTSRKSEAQIFRRWITDEVLPTIRKTGSYVAPGLQPVTSTTQLETIVASLLEEVAQLRSLIKPKARPKSLTKESARSRVFRCHQELEIKLKRPITARDISRYLKHLPVELIKVYLKEYTEHQALQAIKTPRTTKYVSVEQ